MVNDKLILQVNKLNVSPDRNRLKYNQAERGKIVDVVVMDNDGVTPYNLSGKSIIFNDTKTIGNDTKIIIDGGGGAHSGEFITNDADLQQGKFSYRFCDYAFEQSGEAQFEFETDSKHIDVSSTFYIDITATGELKPANTGYVSDMEAFKATYNSLVANFRATSNAKLNEVNNQIGSKLTDLTNQVASGARKVEDYTNKVTTLQTQWNQELERISNKAGADTTNAVNAINQKYTDDFNKLKDSFNSWKTETTSNYTTQINNLIAKAKQNGIDVNDLNNKIKNLQQSLGNIDLTQFVKPSDMVNYYKKNETYNRDEVDAKLKDAGKLKTVSVNGGTKIQPDNSGNANITVPNPDLSNYPTKQDLTNATAGDVKKVDGVGPDASGNVSTGVDAKLGSKLTFKVCDSPQAAHDASTQRAPDGSLIVGIYNMNNEPSEAYVAGDKINIEWLYNHYQDLATQVSNLNGSLNGKANSGDLTGLANRVTALENKKPIKANDQADAVNKSKNSNDWYYW